MSEEIVAGEHLRAFLERIERLEEEKRTIADDIKEVFEEAKAMGFDTKAMRALLAERKQDRADLDESKSTLDLYRASIGMN